MTVHPLLRADAGPWTVDDLTSLPDDGCKYELFDGSVLVSPPPHLRHSAVAFKLRDLLAAQATAGLAVIQEAGVVMPGRTSAYAPDLMVVPRSALEDPQREYLAPADVRLVAEVLSPSNRGRDLVLKRHEYARAGIPRYWIVDPDARTLTVLILNESGTYAEAAVIEAGRHWSTDLPFPLVLDPADFC